MLCAKCGHEKNKGSLLDVKLKGVQTLVCADCYSKLKEEHRLLRSCEECGYWKEDYCRKLKKNLLPGTVIGYKDFFTQAKDCEYFITIESYKKTRTAKIVRGQDRKEKKQPVKETEIIVKIRCSNCRNLYDEALDKCPHCGVKSSG